MFKDKNFGLPKDLIESARSVMQKQLVEYNEDDYIDNPPEGMDKGTREARKKAADMGLKGPHLEREGIIKKPTVKKPATTSSDNLPENHVVKFTSYLKENFHINELTEEEIAWIYENEYVQWLEEGLTISYLTPEEKAKREKEEREREREREREERRLHDEKAKEYEKIPMV